MSQLRVDYINDDFRLVSTWNISANGASHDTPTIAERTVTFEYQLPRGAKVKSAKVYATWGAGADPWGGYQIQTIDGKNAENGYVDVDIDPAGTSKSVVFKYQSYGDNIHTSGTVRITDVYLLIAYSTGASICLAKNGALVPYNFYRVESGVLVPYNLLCAVEDYELVTENLLTADGEQLYTSDSKQFKVLGGT